MRIRDLLMIALIVGIGLIAIQACDRDRAGSMPHHDAMHNSGLPSDDGTTGEPDLIISLYTEFSNGGFLFKGFSEGIEERVNPTLEIKVGQLVEIVLFNEDGIVHDLAIPGLGVSTSRIAQKGTEVRLTFVAETPGSFAYYCTVSGHRQLGMEGILLITE